MIIMSVDLGKARTGLAICDKSELLASPLGMIEDRNLDRVAEKIAGYVKERKAEMLVVGLPKNMDGTEGESAQNARAFAKQLEEKGLKSIIVFGIPREDSKDEIATPDYSATGIVQKAVRRLKKETNLVVITDVCLCQYTSHGHCGMIVENDDTDDGIEILNDESLPYIAKVALSHAEAGADIVAPSDMMDGRVGAIRQCLDENGYTNVMIMSYSAKYASAFYEPFRVAA